MEIRFPKKTVRSTVQFSGRGLHSGAPVEVTVRPGSDGVVFRLHGTPQRAVADSVTDTSRCTRVGEVSTVEHILSALAGTGVTDAEIDLTAPELPAMDGSAAVFVDGIAKVGLRETGERGFRLFERVFTVEGDVRIGISPGTGHWRFDFASGDRWPHSQSFECLLTPETYRSEVAGARTFAFEEEVGPLRAAGLGQGLDLESALILGTEGYQNPPRWPDEPARHKLLDLIGDLSLSGVPPFFLNVVAVKSGHRTNVAAAQRLTRHVQWSALNEQR